jgi:serine/threonine protein kinase
VSLLGQTLGQYRIVEFIGAGGMATVYKAYQPSLDRYVAIKVLPAQHALTPGFKERFILEARAVAQLSHPNILPIYDFGLKEDLSYFVMKYVPDRTLSHLMGQPMALARVSHFIDQVAGALDHAHARGIVHRDIKPANMLLEGDWLLLADFGVAKITENSTVITSTGNIFGTPAYVSPEQAEGESFDHRTDIYSLGVVLYEMVIGRVPYQGTTPMRVINKHIHEPPPAPRSLRPDLTEAVERVILKALAKNPADRYNRARDLAEALRGASEPTALAYTTPLPTPAAASNRPKRQPNKRSIPPSRPPKGAASAQSAVGGENIPAPAEKVIPPEAQLASPLKSGRSGFSKKMTWVAGGLLLLFIVGALIFFTSSGDAEGITPDPTTPAKATQPIVSDSHTPTPTSVLPTATTTPLPSLTTQPTAEVQTLTNTPATGGPSALPATSTIVPTIPVIEATATPVTPTNAPTSTPKPLPVISGTLAIPVKVGSEFKVYVTGFDGAGMNGPAPVSLGNARQPMFRRDGQAIIVNGTTTGALRGIFITDGKGLAPNQLNDRSEAYWPVWSPDGDEILFVDLDRGRTMFRQSSQLASSDADFTQLQTNNVKIVGNNIIWSDDNRLVFQGCADWLEQAGECGIWATNADAVDPVRLTSTSGLPLDAKNGLLTYMLAEDGDWDIYLVSLAGGQPLKLTNNNSQDGLAAIAPDGQSVAYVSNESGNWAVWTVTLSDNQKQKWFDLDPQRGTIDLNMWAEERMSWTQ